MKPGTYMEEILAILAKIRPEADYRSSTDYIADGLLDSFDLVTLVSDLDSAFSISIPGVEITPERFRNAETIAVLVSECKNRK
jgi:acyl carrier protein